MTKGPAWFDQLFSDANVRRWDRSAPALLALPGIILLAISSTHKREGWLLLFLGLGLESSRLFFDPRRMTQLRTHGQMIIATIANTLIATLSLGVLYLIRDFAFPDDTPPLIEALALPAGVALICIQVVALPLWQWWQWSELRRAERISPPDQRTFEDRDHQSALARLHRSELWQEAIRLSKLLSQQTSTETSHWQADARLRLDEHIRLLDNLTDGSGTTLHPESRTYLAQLGELKRSFADLATEIDQRFRRPDDSGLNTV